MRRPTVGKRLSDRLYLSYEQSLSGAMSTVSILYDLSKSLTLRARAGTENAIGFVPITRVLPPGGATIGEALVKPIPMSPAFAICSVKYPSEVQVCAWQTDNRAIPLLRAACAASGKPTAKAG